MNRIAIATLLCCLLAVGSSNAHTVGPTTQGGLSPATADLTGVGVFGIAFCQSLPAVGGSIPFFCGTNGLGVFFDVSGVDDGDSHSHANGNCKVTQGPTQLLGNDFFFSCGTDRNDDNFVTDNEVCTIEDDTDNHGGTVSNHDECTGQTGGTPNEQHADDWVDGTQADVNGKNFCFQDDVGGFTEPTSDDTGQAGADVSALNQAGGSWDDVVVFVGVSAPGSSATSGNVGDVTVTLSITGGASCTGGANVSAHGTPGNTRIGGFATAVGDNPPTCAQEYRDGELTTYPCPPELCGLDQGTVALTSRGPAGGQAPVGTLTCHESGHQTTGTLSTSPGTFSAGGHWIDLAVGPIFSGTHAHCTLTNLGAATYAFVQCGKQ